MDIAFAEHNYPFDFPIIYLQLKVPSFVNTKTPDPTMLLGLRRVRVGDKPDNQGPDFNTPIECDLDLFTRPLDNEVQYGTELIVPGHRSLRSRSWDKHFLPCSISIPITFQHSYSSDLNPVVVVWIHSLRCDAGRGCDFRVSASKITHAGFRLDCHTARH